MEVSPEGTPAWPTLAYVYGWCSLFYQSADLLIHCQLLVAWEVSASEFVTNSLKGIDCFFVDLLHLLLRFLRSPRGFLNNLILCLLKLRLGLVDLNRQLFHDTADDLILDILLNLKVILLIHLLLLISQSPTDDGILCEGLKHSKQTLLILS